MIIQKKTIVKIVVTKNIVENFVKNLKKNIIKVRDEKWRNQKQIKKDGKFLLKSLLIGKIGWVL